MWLLVPAHLFLTLKFNIGWRCQECPLPRSDIISCCAGGLAGFSAAQVEEVRMVLRMLPIFFTTILYWTIYVQVSVPTF